MGEEDGLSLPLPNLHPPFSDLLSSMYATLETWIDPLAQASPGLFLLILLTSIAFGLYLLTKGGDWLSDSSADLASQLGVPPVVVGLTVVSIATSTPELFTSISALRSDAPGLVLGNIIGSNVANVGLILGITLLIAPVNTRNAVSLSQRNSVLLLTLAFCAILLMHPQGLLGMIPGIGLITFMVTYLFFVTLHALRRNSPEEQDPKQASEGRLILFSICMITFSTLALWAGSDALVYGSKNLAKMAGVPEELIGFTLVALGTSLPELSASISLVKKQHSAMLLGNVVGSNLFNIGLIGGLSGVLGPVGSKAPYPWVDYLSLIALTTVLYFWLRGKFLQKSHGMILLALYTLATGITWWVNS